MPVVSISLPESLLEELDEFIDSHGYTGRSEAVRESMRTLISEGNGTELAQGGAFVVLVRFDHDANVEVTLSQLRHSHDDLVTVTVHGHADGDCLELFVVDGTRDEIGSFLARIRAVDGVAGIDYTPVPAADPVHAETGPR